MRRRTKRKTGPALIHRRGMRMHIDPKEHRITLDDDVKEVQRQTKVIHKLEAERRRLNARVKEITKDLKGRRRGLKLFMISSALRTSVQAREEFASALPDREQQTVTQNCAKSDS